MQYIKHLKSLDKFFLLKINAILKKWLLRNGIPQGYYIIFNSTQQKHGILDDNGIKLIEEQYDNKK